MPGTERVEPMNQTEDEIVEAFHKLYYYSRVWANTFWLGVQTLKCPLDLWIYQEIVAEIQPDVIIESGTAYGGSALFLAAVLDQIGKGKVVTIDVETREGLPRHERIEYIVGSSTSESTLQRVRQSIRPGDKVLVILDSAHNTEHVLEELRLYHGFVTPGSYVIVEDTNMGGHPVHTDYAPDSGPGPMAAVLEFLEGNPRFCADPMREKFKMGFNPNGFLRRTS